MDTKPDVRELARSLDCLTESDLNALSGTKPSTTEAWRKRGTGPAHIRFGNAILYPREALAAFLRGKARTRTSVEPKELL